MQSNGQKKNEARLPSALVQGNWLNDLAFSGPLMPSCGQPQSQSSTKCWEARVKSEELPAGGCPPRFSFGTNRGSVPFSALWLCLLCILGPILETGCSFQQVLEKTTILPNHLGFPPVALCVLAHAQPVFLINLSQPTWICAVCTQSKRVYMFSLGFVPCVARVGAESSPDFIFSYSVSMRGCLAPGGGISFASM